MILHVLFSFQLLFYSYIFSIVNYFFFPYYYPVTSCNELYNRDSCIFSVSRRVPRPTTFLYFPDPGTSPTFKHAYENKSRENDGDREKSMLLAMCTQESSQENTLTCEIVRTTFRVSFVVSQITEITLFLTYERERDIYLMNSSRVKRQERQNGDM